MVLTTLAHHVDVEFLREAYRRTRKVGAPGVDGQTAAEYEEDLEGNLQVLLARFKAGNYRAPPVRRVHIPKGDGTTRPIGIPTLEDKVLQRAVHMLLEAVYEQDFLPCSYGFRGGRSAHQALKALRGALMRLHEGWVVEADIQGFFDNLDHACLRSFLDQRVRDGVVRRTIGKWLKAGIFEDGTVRHPESGTPQGGVISPLLANVYLHEVLDKWFEHEIKPRLEGSATLVRYADDFVIVLSSERDARWVWDVLPKRFGRYNLDLHPDKSGIVPFRRPPLNKRQGAGEGTFDFLGFTHHWARSRKGNWVVKQKTARSRLARAVRTVATWCRRNRHLPVSYQATALGRKIKGHCGYYGITGNSRALSSYVHHLRVAWRKWLNRRSHRARMTWEKFIRMLEHHPLPAPVAVHSVLRSTPRTRSLRSRMRQ